MTRASDLSCGGRSRRHRPVLQPGNELTLTWKARLSDHLGQFHIEPETLRAGDLMTSSLGLAALQHLAFLLRLLPERHAYPRLFNALTVVLDHLEASDAAAALLVRFELEVLRDLGIGLDLSSCAATGSNAKIIATNRVEPAILRRMCPPPWPKANGGLIARRIDAVDGSGARTHGFDAEKG